MAWSSLEPLEIPTKADVQEEIRTTDVKIQRFETINTVYGNLFKIKYSNYEYPIIFGSLSFLISAGDGGGKLYTFPTAWQIYCNGHGGHIAFWGDNNNYANIYLHEKNITYSKHGSADKYYFFVQICNRALNA